MIRRVLDIIPSRKACWHCTSWVVGEEFELEGKSPAGCRQYPAASTILSSQSFAWPLCLVPTAHGTYWTAGRHFLGAKFPFKRVYWMKLSRILMHNGAICYAFLNWFHRKTNRKSIITQLRIHSCRYRTRVHWLKPFGKESCLQILSRLSMFIWPDFAFRGWSGYANVHNSIGDRNRIVWSS